MSQEQPQVSKADAARSASRRRARRSRNDGEPDSPYWQPDWYRPPAPRSGDEDDDGQD
jgi:hypothetical protein